MNEMKMTAKQIRELASANPTIPGFLQSITKLGRDYHTDPLVDAAYNAGYAYANMANETRGLVQVAGEAQRNLSREVVKPADLNLSTGIHLYTGFNSCGELQGRSSSFEIAVARYYDAMKAVEGYICDRVS